MGHAVVATRDIAPVAYDRLNPLDLVANCLPTLGDAALVNSATIGHAVPEQAIDVAQRRESVFATDWAETGFSSSQHFATSFREAYGCTPSGYRSQID